MMKIKLNLLVIIPVVLASFAACVNNEVKTIALDKSTSTLLLGQTDSLISTLTVTGDINKLPQTWNSSNSTVASVKNGLITALKTGTTIITVQAGDKSATCQVTVDDKILPVLSAGILEYCGDAYGTTKDSIDNIQSNNFIIYLAEATADFNNYFGGTDDRVMIELNTDTIYKTAIPSGTYDMMTDLTQSKLLPFTIVPAYVSSGYPWGSWYFGGTINDIVVGNLVVLNTNDIYDIQYHLIDYYGNTISGTYHGALTYYDNSSATAASPALKKILKKNQLKIMRSDNQKLIRH